MSALLVVLVCLGVALSAFYFLPPIPMGDHQHQHQHQQQQHQQQHQQDQQEEQQVRADPKQQQIRVLILCMQSSGCTLFAHLLAQHPRAVAIFDLWSPSACPASRSFNHPHHQIVILKKVIRTGSHNRNLDSVNECMDAFAPHMTLLFLRNPLDNLVALAAKIYACDMGTPLDKLDELERLFTEEKHLFQHVVTYEALFSDPRAIVETINNTLVLSMDGIHLRRSVEEILAFTLSTCPWCKRYFRHRGGWGLGNMHAAAASSAILASNGTWQPRALSDVGNLRLSDIAQVVGDSAAAEREYASIVAVHALVASHAPALSRFYNGSGSGGGKKSVDYSAVFAANGGERLVYADVVACHSCAADWCGRKRARRVSRRKKSA